MRHSHLAILVAALLFIRHLVFDLERTSPGLDHLLGEQIGGFSIAKAGVNIGNNRHDMRLEIVNLALDVSFLRCIARSARLVKVAEQQVQFTRVGLAQEGVKFFNQRRHAGLFMHGLIGQRAEF